eukprot:39252-Eustigmatos_ZCMA.PRE.1
MSSASISSFPYEWRRRATNVKHAVHDAEFVWKHCTYVKNTHVRTRMSITYVRSPRVYTWRSTRIESLEGLSRACSTDDEGGKGRDMSS